VGDHKHAYWTTPTDQNSPGEPMRLPAKGQYDYIGGLQHFYMQLKSI